MSAEPCCWVAVVGGNGVGKSTLLHAIAGTVPFVSGVIELGSFRLPAGDPASRFAMGVHMVRQDAAFGESSLSLAEARALAFSLRPGIDNVPAVDALIGELSAARWFDRDMPLPGRVFDLLVAIMSVPRVLLLDEVRVGVPSVMADATGAGSAAGVDLYRQIGSALPFTTVVFTDHDIDVALAVASDVIWLREGKPARRFKVSDVDSVLDVRSELKATANASIPELGVCSDFASLDDREPVVSQVETALKSAFARSSERRVARDLLFGYFPFLKLSCSAGELSGGQRVILLWVMLEVTSMGVVARNLKEHLDGRHRGLLGQCEDEMSELRVKGR